MYTWNSDSTFHQFGKISLKFNWIDFDDYFPIIFRVDSNNIGEFGRYDLCYN